MWSLGIADVRSLNGSVTVRLFAGVAGKLDAL
jgi:hypothetical protein